jgi:branched-chain amino acid transport system permease protein
MLLQQLVNGLTLGTTYALIALGYTMVYGIIQLINFAHGEVYMIGAFVGLIMVAVYKVNFFLAMLAAMAVCVPLAVLIERVGSPTIADTFWVINFWVTLAASLLLP